ncbi:class I SAM-dependent methyltransferase [uncultured Thomasclavelia sp.]|uniref:tRNA (mnm(5)s(2)U34)-methyltransferase n=1 Tax=uncultured Thomasclavelia sp. TaxID=3025759 RepID=UPI0025E23FED|nr:class I SAM-dependent methyltransferase [uncultured Thomasclavelia sp.]
MESMIDFIHNRIEKKHYDVAVDFTMGNGHDTLFLSNLADKVYSFDIQQQALDKTSELLGNKENVTLILDSHEHVDKYVEQIDVGVFNLGYLPNGDHSITTKADSSLIAIKKGIELLKPDGILYLVVYVGHEEGKRESKVIDEYVSNLDFRLFNVGQFKMINKELAPYVLMIEKRKLPG